MPAVDKDFAIIDAEGKIAEAFVALVLIDHALRHRAQNGDVAEKVMGIQAAAGKVGGGRD